MATPSDASALLESAKCLLCLPAGAQVEIQTYLLSILAGGSQNPGALAEAANSFGGLHGRQLDDVLIYLYCRVSGLEGCTAEALADDATCYGCIPDGSQPAVQTYQLATLAGASTDPSELAQAAIGFRGLGKEKLLQMQAYLLTQIIPLSDSVADIAQSAECMRCIPGQVRESVQTFLVVTYTGGGACVDNPADLIPVIAGSYTAGELTNLSILLPKVCCNPEHFDVYEADDAVGTGAVLYDVSAPIPEALGGTSNLLISYNIPVPAPTKPYLLVVQVCADATESDFSNAVIFAEPLNPVVQDWVDRVIANGGGEPSDNTQGAVNTFYNGLVSDGLLAKMRHVNIMAPDDLIACSTPLIVGAGYDPWNNAGGFFQEADLTINGLSNIANGNAGDCVMATGMIPWSQSNFGFTIYTSTTVAGVDFPVFGQMTGTPGPLNPNLKLYLDLVGTTYFDCWNESGGRVSAANAGWIGYTSLNRDSATHAVVWQANSGVAHNQLMENNNAAIGTMPVPGAGVEPNIWIFTASVDGQNGLANTSRKRVSFVAFHDALTVAESALFFNLIQAFRTSIGGGFV